MAKHTPLTLLSHSSRVLTRRNRPRYVNFRQNIRFLSVEPVPLKVPKREIFDRSDFPDFYTIKPLRVGDFGVKIKKMFTNI
jgi:hypothetical protein